MTIGKCKDYLQVS